MGFRRSQVLAVLVGLLFVAAAAFRSVDPSQLTGSPAVPLPPDGAAIDSSAGDDALSWKLQNPNSQQPGDGGSFSHVSQDLQPSGSDEDESQPLRNQETPDGGVDAPQDAVSHAVLIDSHTMTEPIGEEGLTRSHEGQGPEDGAVDSSENSVGDDGAAMTHGSDVSGLTPTCISHFTAKPYDPITDHVKLQEIPIIPHDDTPYKSEAHEQEQHELFNNAQEVAAEAMETLNQEEISEYTGDNDANEPEAPEGGEGIQEYGHSGEEAAHTHDNNEMITVDVSADASFSVDNNTHYDEAATDISSTDDIPTLPPTLHLFDVLPALQFDCAQSVDTFACDFDLFSGVQILATHARRALHNCTLRVDAQLQALPASIRNPLMRFVNRTGAEVGAVASMLQSLYVSVAGDNALQSQYFSIPEGLEDVLIVCAATLLLLQSIATVVRVLYSVGWLLTLGCCFRACRQKPVDHWAMPSQAATVESQPMSQTPAQPGLPVVEIATSVKTNKLMLQLKKLGESAQVKNDGISQAPASSTFPNGYGSSSQPPSDVDRPQPPEPSSEPRLAAEAKVSPPAFSFASNIKPNNSRLNGTMRSAPTAYVPASTDARVAPPSPPPKSFRPYEPSEPTFKPRAEEDSHSTHGAQPELLPTHISPAAAGPLVVSTSGELTSRPKAFTLAANVSTSHAESRTGGRARGSSSISLGATPATYSQPAETSPVSVPGGDTGETKFIMPVQQQNAHKFDTGHFGHVAEEHSAFPSASEPWHAPTLQSVPEDQRQHAQAPNSLQSTDGPDTQFSGAFDSSVAAFATDFLQDGGAQPDAAWSGQTEHGNPPVETDSTQYSQQVNAVSTEAAEYQTYYYDGAGNDLGGAAEGCVCIRYVYNNGSTFQQHMLEDGSWTEAYALCPPTDQPQYAEDAAQTDFNSLNSMGADAALSY